MLLLVKENEPLILCEKRLQERDGRHAQQVTGVTG
jgi:hypothetical protein